MIESTGMFLALGDLTGKKSHGAACCSTAQRWGEFKGCSHQGLANFCSGSSCSSNAATFFWTSMTS
nr:hypothetical protein [Limnohabitans sp. DM1]